MKHALLDVFEELRSEETEWRQDMRVGYRHLADDRVFVGKSQPLVVVDDASRVLRTGGSR